jgi:hypothetical protein
MPLGSPGRNPALAKGNQLPNLLKHPVVETIAKAHNKGPGQILLRHLVQQDIIVIPKSVSAERVKQNFEIWDFTLTPEEMKQLNDLDKGAEGRSMDFITFCKGWESNIKMCIFSLLIFGASILLNVSLLIILNYRYDTHPEYPFGDY